MVNVTHVLWFGLAVLLIVGIVCILLQIFLSRREEKWPGLILPVISFLWSLLYLFGLMSRGSLLEDMLMALFTMLLTNIPTFVLLAIYFACREKRKQRSDIDKMNIQDL